MRRISISLGTVIYILMGVAVAIDHGYAADELHTASQYVNMILATILWPLVFIGTHFNVHIG